ncbi:hypothetical protein CDV36_016097, partial [Fusarium kuroshium]
MGDDKGGDDLRDGVEQIELNGGPQLPPAESRGTSPLAPGRRRWRVPALTSASASKLSSYPR